MGVNSPKYRDYFITINQGAESYDKALEITKETNHKLYALIVHDKDQIWNDETKNWEPKKRHKHIVIELKNPISFQSMQNKFAGAHIETIHYKKSAYQYLIHNTPSSKAEKYQYDTSEIISNNLEAVKLTIETETSELFIETRFLRYIVEGTITPYQFCKRFGLNAYKQYWKAYSDMIFRIDTDEEMQQDIQKEKELIDKESPF